MNTRYAPYLPADEEGSAIIDNYIKMLDKKYSLEPLIRALTAPERDVLSNNEKSTSNVQHASVSFFFNP